MEGALSREQVRSEAELIEMEMRQLLLRWIALFPSARLDADSGDPTKETAAAMLKALASISAFQTAPDEWLDGVISEYRLGVEPAKTPSH